MNPQAKLSICIFSDANFLAVNILENLLSKNCVINVVTDDVFDWQKETANLFVKSRFGIVKIKDSDTTIAYDYVIFCGGFMKKEKAYADYHLFASFPNLASSKTLVLFPLEVFDRHEVDKIKFGDNLGVLFLGDLLGPRIDLDNDLLVSRAIAEIVQKRKLTLAVGEVFRPIFVADVVRIIVKWLFSFGPYGKEIVLSGSQISGDTFWNCNQKLIGGVKLNYNPRISPRVFPKGYEVYAINSNIQFSLAETYRWLSNNWAEYSDELGRERKPIKIRPRSKVKLPRGTKPIVALLLLILGFPFFALLVFFSVSLFSYKEFTIGKYDTVENSILLAKTFAVASERESAVLAHVPGLGLVYKETQFAANLGEEVSGLALHSAVVIETSAQLFGNILGDKVYDPSYQSTQIESGLTLLYDDVSHIQDSVENASVSKVILAKKILARVDFEKFKKLVFEGRVLAQNLPAILGNGESRTYLILFENNMELRPTGGFIGSYGLVTFDSGRLSDLTVSDVFSADGQLSGHVEPPGPIKNYLGEANWWLRDSNWDPDFPTSAKRAEWFLGKEVNREVDGVVAVDLSPIKEILKFTGPVFLPDFNMDITSENLYEKTQSEVESKFFPGTHKKASFLTALSRGLLAEIIKLKTSQKLSVLESFYNSLDQRHAQIYLHDDIPQTAISALDWDGSVVTPTCGPNCYADLAGLAEANVGDNKANYFIQRTINLSIKISSDEVDRKLTLNLKNSANPALGPSGKYRDYIRVLIPTDATLLSVESYSGNTQGYLLPEITDVKDRREVGVLVELLGGESKSIEFAWATKLNVSYPLVSYGLYIRKQAGTGDDPVNLEVSNSGIPVQADPRFSLTRAGTYVYNTTLARDLFLRFSW